MDAGNLVEQFWLETNDLGDDIGQARLWSEPEVLGYIDDAQKMFCRLFGGIRDARSALTQISASVGNPWAAYDPRILQVISARRLSDDAPVRVVNYENLDQSVSDDDYGSTSRFRIDTETGAVRYLVSNMEEGKFRLVKIPVVTDTIALVVDRLPLRAVAECQDRLEVREEHQVHLLMWVKHRAYSKQDADTFDKSKAAGFKVDFMAYCAQARAERERRYHKPRAVAYGGI